MRTDRFLGIAGAGLLVLCILLGGASAPRAGAAANGLLQFVSVLLLLFGIWTARGMSLPAGTRPLICIFLAFLAAGLLTLVPLPAGLWTALPGRAPTAHGFELLGLSPPALPLSLAPQNTIASLLWLLPPAAMFLLALQLSPERRRWLLRTLLAMAGLSIVLGAAQLLGGSGSRLRFYTITNETLAVGFFSNANHLATLLVCTLPVTGYLAGRSVSRSRARNRRFSAVMVAAALGVLLLIGVAIIGSTAGYGLALPATLTALLIYRRAAYGPLGTKWVAAFAALFALFAVLAVAGPLSRESLSEELSNDGTSRAVLAANSLEVIGATFPVGTGLGTFADVYRTVERPDPDVREFANHAHNDYLEIVLEMGVAGALFVLAFLVWFGRRALTVWRSDDSGASAGRVGSVMIMLVLLHSLVDYPLRTSAIAALFAMACALMLPSPSPPRRSSAARSSAADPDRPDAARHVEAD